MAQGGFATRRSMPPGCKPTASDAGKLLVKYLKSHANGFTLTLQPSRLQEPLRRKKPAVYFVNSMSDLFHEAIPDDYIRKVFEVIENSPRHTFQVLTKRAERMACFFESYDAPKNAWLGVTVEDRKFGLPRIAELRRINTAIRFLSMEPLLEDLGEPGLTMIQWVIVGGESGHKARPIQLKWVEGIRR